MDSVWVRFHPLAGYGKNGTPVRYVGYMGAPFEVQPGKWAQCTGYACLSGYGVQGIHGCGMQGR